MTRVPPSHAVARASAHRRRGRHPGPSIMWIADMPLDVVLDSATWTRTAEALTDSGARVVLVHPGVRAPACRPDVEVRSVPKPSVYAVGQLLYLARLIREVWHHRRDHDVLLLHPTAAPLLIVLRVLRALGTTRMIGIMDVRTVFMSTIAGVSLRVRLRRRYLAAMIAIGRVAADGITAITVRLARVLRLLSRRFLGEWPSGVSHTPFAAYAVQREWPAAGDEIRIVYIGSLARERNLLELALGVEAANERGNPCRLDLYGAGIDDQRLARIVESGKAVAFHGPVAHAAVPRLLSEAHVGVLPFPNTQMFRVSSPIKLFEYMASDIPVLATRIACHTDIAGDKDFAFWVEDSAAEGFATAIDEIRTRIPELPRMGARASETARAWTWETSAARLYRAVRRATRGVGDPPWPA